jgi:hypothetical protein
MKKQRTSPTILKPVIDEKTALRFASAASVPVPESSTDKLAAAVSKWPAAKKAPRDEGEKDMRQISLTISRSLYNRIAKEAARKNRTIEEHLTKHLAKRYEK